MFSNGWEAFCQDWDFQEIRNDHLCITVAHQSLMQTFCHRRDSTVEIISLQVRREKFLYRCKGSTVGSVSLGRTYLCCCNIAVAITPPQEWLQSADQIFVVAADIPQVQLRLRGCFLAEAKDLAINRAHHLLFLLPINSFLFKSLSADSPPKIFTKHT